MRGFSHTRHSEGRCGSGCKAALSCASNSSRRSNAPAPHPPVVEALHLYPDGSDHLLDAEVHSIPQRQQKDHPNHLHGSFDHTLVAHPPGSRRPKRHPTMPSKVPELLVQDKVLPAGPDHTGLEIIDPMPFRNTAAILERTAVRRAPVSRALVRNRLRVDQPQNTLATPDMSGQNRTGRPLKTPLAVGDAPAEAWLAGALPAVLGDSVPGWCQVDVHRIPRVNPGHKPGARTAAVESGRVAGGASAARTGPQRCPRSNPAARRIGNAARGTADVRSWSAQALARVAKRRIRDRSC